MVLTNFQKSISRLIVGLFAAFSFVFLAAIPANAQTNTSQNITMSPASTLVSVKPGGTVEKKFEILNTGGDAYSIVTTASPYHVAGLEYTPQFTQLPGATETTSWVKVYNPLALVDPQKSAEVKYSVTVPANTPPGGYYVVLFAETRPMGLMESSGVVPRNRVGNILYITVEGPVQISGDVAATTVGGFKYQPSIPVGFKVSNNGGIHFQTTVGVKIKSFTGKEVYNVTMERYVLPGTERDIPIEWAPTAPVGIYTVSRTANVAETDRKIPDETIIYIQPWVILTTLILIIVTILYFTSRASKRRKEGGSKEHKKSAKKKKKQSNT